MKSKGEFSKSANEPPTSWIRTGGRNYQPLVTTLLILTDLLQSQGFYMYSTSLVFIPTSDLVGVQTNPISLSSDL